MNTLTVIPGVSLPFFPMRPLTGPMLRTESDIAQVLANTDYHWQPKLNGDRVIFAKVGGKVYLCNRHNNWYSYAIQNQFVWEHAPDQTVLDGEVWNRKFYPFEALVVAGQSLLRDCVTVRAKAAKELSHELMEPFLFDSPTEEWLRANLIAKPKEWEGLVGKRKNSPYLILGTQKDTPGVVKRKWVI